jgi:parallel beta-helix repeat protein
MAKINDGTLKDWKDGDKVTSDLYEADREILRVANNDNHDRIVTLEVDKPVQDKRLDDLEYNVTGTVVPMTFKELGMQNLTFDDIKLGYVDQAIAKAWKPSLDTLTRGIVEETTATDGQTVVNLTNSYTVGGNQITVEIDGVPQDDTSYTETSTTSITLSEALVAGQRVVVTIGKVDPNADARFSSMGDSITSLTTQMADIATNLDSFPIQPTETDDKARMLRMFESAKTNGKRAVIIPKGVYTLASQLTLDNYNDLLIIANGASINFTYNTNSTSGTVKALNIINSSNIIVDGLKINVQNRSLTKQYDGIEITNSHDILLRRVNVQNAGWIGISIYDVIVGTSYNIDIDNCIVEYCRFGIVSTGNFVHIKNRTYVSNHWSLSTEATSQGTHPVWKSTPTDSEWYDGVIIKGKYWVIENCIIEDNGQSGIYSGGTSNGLISGCTIKNNWNKGIDLGASRTGGVSSIQNVTVETNTVMDNKTGQIHLYKVDNSKVIGNDALVLDTSYSDVPSYIQSSIILNQDNLNNIIQGNTIIQNFTSSVAIFVNSTTPKSIGNKIKDNTIVASQKYNINYDDNLVTDASNGTQQYLSDVQFLRRITKVLNIDLTIGGLTGYDGRNALNLNASSDNTNVQVTANKLIKFAKPDGSGQDVSLGALQTTSATLGGLTYLSDDGALKLPRTAQTNSGYIWYDATNQVFKVTLGSGVVKTLVMQ